MQKELWFNQDGNSLEEEETEVNGEFVDTITGDEIDQFSESGNISVSHNFDESGVPEEVNITLRAEECEFIKVELKDSIYDLNFAKTEGDLKRIYEKIEILEGLLSSQNCN